MRIFDQPRTLFVPRIRIINLVDILFILLIFFVATTTFRIDQPSAVKLALPEAKTAEQIGKEKTKHVYITVGADESIYIDNTPVALTGLEAALREAKAKTPDLLLQLSADKTVNYGTIVSIVDAARAVGISDITAFTKKSMSPP